MIETNTHYLVVSAKPAVSKRGTKYIITTLESIDREYSEFVIAKAQPDAVKVGQVVMFKKIKTENDSQSALFSDTTVADCPKESPLYFLTPHGPSQKEWNKVRDDISKLIVNKSLKDVWQSAMNDLYEPFSEATAATTNHHAYIGGLAQHTIEMLRMFVALYPTLPFNVNPFIAAMGCLWHDSGKIAEYDLEHWTVTPAYTLQGHPFLSAEAVGEYLRNYADFEITDELIQHVQHCVLSHHGRLEYGSPVLPATAEAFLVSKLDSLSGSGVQFSRPTGTRAFGTIIQHYSENA